LQTTRKQSRNASAKSAKIRLSALVRRAQEFPDIVGTVVQLSCRKPYYPEAARRLRAKGEVVVAAVADESGKVVFARIVNGNKLFRRAALEAAYKATHTRKIYCDRPVKFWWTIRYMFHPDM
jgi:TonB family protein